MTTAEKYVTAAYLVVLAAVLLYVVLYAFKISRLEREIEALAEDVSREARDSAPAREKASVGQ
jgi:hypothetical protein